MSIFVFKSFLLLTLIARISAFCPSNSINNSFDGNCYFGIVLTNATFQQADDFCLQYFDGHSASVHNAFDNQALLQLSRKLFPNGSNVWLGGSYDGTKITWTDGTTDNYQNFLLGAMAGNVVMSLTDGKWSTTSPNTQLSFLCVSGSTVTCQSPCPSGWYYVAELQNCYKPIFSVTAAQANDTCQSAGGSIVSIHSEAENEIVNHLLQCNRPLGDPTTDRVLIGGSWVGPNQTDFQWFDGSAWDYTNWATDRPMGDPSQENCLNLEPDVWNIPEDQSRYFHKWENHPCDFTHRASLCKKKSKY